jgi:hypothetical protein
MRAIFRWYLKLAVLGLAAGVTVAGQTRPDPAPGTQTGALIEETMAMQAFQERVAGYVTLHRILEGPLPPLRPTTNMEEVRTNMQLLAKRILAIRQNAQQGDIITPDVARMFRRRIVACLPPEEWTAILAELAEDEEGVPVPRVALRVNMPWPEQVPYGYVPTQMLLALPPLPPELEYRIIGRSLVLWDHHADLIVDYVTAAFTS